MFDERDDFEPPVCHCGWIHYEGPCHCDRPECVERRRVWAEQEKKLYDWLKNGGLEEMNASRTEHQDPGID